MKRTVKKGRHWSWPLTIKRAKNNLHSFIISAEDADMWKYELENFRGYSEHKFVGIALEYWKKKFPTSNQADWNKLCGIKKNFFQPRKNSTMIGWRYNPIDECVEFVPYWHDENGGAHFGYEPFAMDCKGIDDTSRISISISPLRHKINILSYRQMADSTEYVKSKTWELPQNAYTGKGWLILHWFGGQMKAQKDITFNIEV